MKYGCEMIKDLIPLYADNVCSEESGQIVKEHMEECAKCKEFYQSIKKTEIGEVLNAEKEGVIKRQKKVFKRKSLIVGLVFASIFMIPVVSCLIINLAMCQGLDWFFVVLTSLMVGASLIVVPLMVPRYKLFWTIVSFTISLMLLFLSCGMITSMKWFMTGATSTLFGMSLILMPIILNIKPLKRPLKGKKMLVFFATETTLYILMMLSIGFMTGSLEFWKYALAISLPFGIYFWLLMADFFYLPVNALVKWGASFCITGGFIFTVEQFMNFILGNEVIFYKFYPIVWNYATLNSNIKWLALIALTTIGLNMIFWGMVLMGIRRKRRRG